MSEADLPVSKTSGDAVSGTEPPPPEPAEFQPDPVPEPLDAAAPDDRVEWQPVIDGDRIEWQPVMVSDATGEPPVAVPEPEVEAEPPMPPIDAAAAVVEPDAAVPAWPAGEGEDVPTHANPWPEAPVPETDVTGAEPTEGDVPETDVPATDLTDPEAGEPEATEAGDWEEPATDFTPTEAGEAGDWPDQGPAFDYPDEPVPDAEWDPATEVDTAAPVAGANGAETARGRRPPPRSRPRPGSGARRPAARPPAGKRPRQATADEAPAPNVKKQVIVLTLLTLLVLGIGGTAFFLSRDATDTGEEAQDGATPPASSSVASTLPESALQTFSDPETGFTVKYPRAWERLVPPVADIRLVVNAGGNDGFQVRVAPIQTPATTDNIGNFKAVTDAVVLGDQSARLLQEQLVTVNGHLTYYYLYSFQDPVTNTQGVHAHYFIFEGLRVFMVNFQTVPIDEFPKQAGVFDQIAESFAIPPRTATTAPTEPAPTTTVP